MFHKTQISNSFLTFASETGDLFKIGKELNAGDKEILEITGVGKEGGDGFLYTCVRNGM
jgi:hypothetical protein